MFALNVNSSLYDKLKLNAVRDNAESHLVSYHRRRIYTEEKAKVVAASWGTELLQFLATLAILQQDEMKNRLKCTLFFNSFWG